MKRPGSLFAVGAILFALTIAGLTALAEPASLKLSFLPDLTPDIQALPRLLATTPAMARINDQLSQLDAKETSWAANCDVDPPNSYVERAVGVVFAGPRYFGLLTLNESFCPGAAHPNSGAMPLTFDLATGAEVNWPDLFPSKLQDPIRHPNWTGYVIGSKALTALYLSQAADMDAGCSPEIVSDNNGYFHVWPSAVDRGLVLQPTGLAYSNQACADPVVLSTAILRREGFPDELIAALEAPLPLPNPDTP